MNEECPRRARSTPAEYEGIINAPETLVSPAGRPDSLREMGREVFMELRTCETCGGPHGLRKESLWFRVGEKNIAELRRHESQQAGGLVFWPESKKNSTTNRTLLPKIF